MNYIGIDLSLTSPAVCVHIGDDFSFDNCRFYFLTDIQKRVNTFLTLRGDVTVTAFPMNSYSSPEERYHNITTHIMKVIDQHNVVQVFLEDYAYNATGQVFQIAENAGQLKYRLWTRKLEYTCIPPTVIKKFATDKGNATKEMMEAAFLQETGIELKGPLGMTKKQWNPSSDLIDAYYIVKCGMEQLNGIGPAV
jgi:Holliday junction resolvasome RuvABC endonuclease subunit